MRMIADRPVGLLLSGGVDSTVIASRLAQQQLTGLQAFTAAFPGTDFDESQTARETAVALGLPHASVVIPDDVDKNFPQVVAALDEPFADPSSLPTWYLAREVSRHVKVVLVGDGGDELFAGYKRVATHLRTRWRRRWKLPLALRPALQGGKLAAELAMGWRDAYSLRFSGFSPPQRAFLQGGHALPALSYWRLEPPAATPLEDLLGVDRENYLPEYILRKSDLCTMAHGLEARAPLLDHRFVQRLLSVPMPERFTRPPKALLQKALDPRLPMDLIRRKKRGFNPPLRKWLRGTLARRFEGLGARLEAQSGGQLKGPAVDALIARYRGGGDNGAETVLQLLMLDESLGQLAELTRAHA
jgi:asparagine synthase (glutamine-hydrolysing)